MPIDPAFFPGRSAGIFYRSVVAEESSLKKAAGELKSLITGEGADSEIGIMGILHPSVLEKFEIGFPCSAVELSLEPFKKEVQSVWVNP